MRTKQPPQENELKEACQSVKSDHPDFGVKRVFKELEQRKPRWRLTEKRVQKCMKKYGLTCKATPPSPLRDDDEVAPTASAPRHRKARHHARRESGDIAREERGSGGEEGGAPRG